MRMKLRLLNASSELLFGVDVGNLPETYGADSIKEGYPFIRYQGLERRPFQSVINNDAQQAGEPVLKERKHTPTIHICLLLSQTGDCLNQNV